MNFLQGRKFTTNSIVTRFAILLAAVVTFSACSSVADGNPVNDDNELPSSRSSSATAKSSSDAITESSSSNNSGSAESADSLLARYTDWVSIPASSIKRGAVTFSADSFKMAKTEVTQSLYKKVMGELPKMSKYGDDIPVANLNWYDAALFCNALSKKVGLDTAYIYNGMGDSRYLKDLTINYQAKSVRLPTEIEWEIAYRAGTASTYYWGTGKAQEYAYYAQTSGPIAVGQFKPNSYGLYDMGGNVAEWVNDWFGQRPTTAQNNYTGPKSGTAKITRGGGWSDVVKVMSADSVVKKDPLYQSEKQGMRLVHSVGF